MMRTRSLLMLGLVTVLACGSAFGQADDTTSNEMSAEMFIGLSKPFVEPLAGYSQWSLDQAADIEPGISIGGILGFQGVKHMPYSNILRSQANGAYFIYVTEGDNQPETFSLSAIRFGFTQKESYAYAFGQGAFGSGDDRGIYFSAAKAPLSWYSVSLEDNPGQLNGVMAMQRFPDALRFGESSTASIDLRVAGPLSVNLGFEWAQVYERHMFWYWAGSGVIEGITDGLAGWFVRAIGKNSPGAMPIMHFILRNGVAMGFKALRMDQMNWPFTTAAPLNVMTYSVGVSVIF